MKVLKFGGSSVATPENIKKVISILKEASKESQIVVVFSAFGGITDTLIAAGNKAESKDDSYKSICKQIEERHLTAVRELIAVNNQSSVLGHVKKIINNLESILDGIYLINEFTNKTYDKIVSIGELLSSYIITEALKSNSINAIYKDSRELLKTDSNFSNATILKEITYKNIASFFSESAAAITVFPGFVASNSKEETTTLGRGGSDYTAALIAAAMDSEILEIWTDVSGMFTANPTIVKQALPIEQISYQEAMELSHFGAKVLYPPTIQPVLEKNIEILIKNTFAPTDKGTLITEIATDTKNQIKGISHISKIAIITLEGVGMVGIPGFSKRLFEALLKQKINIVLITQASSEHSICLGINEVDADTAKQVIDAEFEYEIATKKVEPLIVEKNQAIIAVVGDNMKSHQGISGKMFSSLGKNNVNIRAIAQGASEKNISAIISNNDIKKALNTLHDAFFEDHLKQLNLFIVGVGNVGSKLLDQIKNQQQYLKEKLHLELRVIAVANSKKMYFDEDGIDCNSWDSKLKNTTLEFTSASFIQKIKDLNYRNSIFIDNTANEAISNDYKTYLKNSIAIVTCNKIACSANYDSYQNLKDLAREYNAPFLFETNVGAGLPIINTLSNLIASGDKVTKIQAVLSGSLNFIFNNFSESKSFYNVVKQAGIEGYTEPDPRIDLSGVDVMRKILILARESGNKMELEDIKNESFLPESSLKAESVNDFLKTLEEEAEHFNKIRMAAEQKKCKLKYVAEFNNGNAKVGLQQVSSDHPFYNLEGKDNIVLFYTDRYSEQPLIVKGAGAGADVTASGLFADIIRIGNN